MDQRLTTATQSEPGEPRRRPLAALDSELRETIRSFWRHKWAILGVVVLLTGLAVLYVQTATPRYTAELQVVFENKTGPLFDFQAAVAGAPQDEASILTEIEVIRSRKLADRVIKALQLDQDPEFNGKLRPPSALSTFFKDTLGLDLFPAKAPNETDPTQLTVEELLDKENNKIIDAVLEDVQAKQIPRSRAVVINFTSESSRTAARVLNTLSELYLVARLEDKFDNAQRASSWLAGRIQVLREKVEASEREIEAYRKRHGLFEGRATSLVTEHVSDLSTKLTDATIERRAAEARLAQVRNLKNAENVDTAVQVLDSSLIQRFREQELELERKEAELGQSLGARHPAMIQLQAERERFRQKLQAEIGKIVQRAENEVVVARGREAALQRDLAAVKGDMVQSNQASIGLRALEREADANKLLLEQFLASFMQASAQEDMRAQLPDARVVSPAAMPDKPSYPRKVFVVMIAFLGSILVGGLLALTLESLDAGFRSAEQIEAVTELPVLAHVPLLTAAKGGGDRPETFILKRPDSAYAEAIRSLNTRLLLAFPEGPPKVLVLTSAEPDEGKSTLGLSLVRAQAQADRSTLLIDADFRRSRLTTRVTGISAQPGLYEVLSDQATAEDAIQSDPASLADLMVSGGGSSADRKVLSDAAKLERLLATLRNRYDLIVIDAPPALALAEGQVIPMVADATLLVVRWGKTRKRVVRYTMDQLTRFGMPLHGVVLNMVDVRKQAYYGYGDAGYYYGKRAKYYTS
ncbi:MAG: polysaccharide biosynthesis tyrosine autokinase [Defluviicoccus sp.]|nr:polysaccharide biosynthesis tyrosine autokinase [Defluviicoccus sp.]